MNHILAIPETEWSAPSEGTRCKCSVSDYVTRRNGGGERSGRAIWHAL